MLKAILFSTSDMVKKETYILMLLFSFFTHTPTPTHTQTHTCIQTDRQTQTFINKDKYI